MLFTYEEALEYFQLHSASSDGYETTRKCKGLKQSESIKGDLLSEKTRCWWMTSVQPKDGTAQGTKIQKQKVRY